MLDYRSNLRNIRQISHGILEAFPDFKPWCHLLVHQSGGVYRQSPRCFRPWTRSQLEFGRPALLALEERSAMLQFFPTPTNNESVVDRPHLLNT